MPVPHYTLTVKVSKQLLHVFVIGIRRHYDDVHNDDASYELMHTCRLRNVTMSCIQGRDLFLSSLLARLCHGPFKGTILMFSIGLVIFGKHFLF